VDRCRSPQAPPARQHQHSARGRAGNRQPSEIRCSNREPGYEPLIGSIVDHDVSGADDPKLEGRQRAQEAVALGDVIRLPRVVELLPSLETNFAM
jgi:hypothetical protein